MESVLTEHIMEILDQNGDTKLIWDSTKPDEVKNAERTFRDLKAKGYVAYSVDKKGEKGTVLNEFDEDAEKIIMAPQMRGG